MLRHLGLVVPTHDDRVQQEGAQNVGPDVDEGWQVHPDVPPHLLINRNRYTKNEGLKQRHGGHHRESVA